MQLTIFKGEKKRPLPLQVLIKITRTLRRIYLEFSASTLAYGMSNLYDFVVSTYG
jgi:hypothetical protein